MPTAQENQLMPQKIMSEIWDYIAQEFRDTISRAAPEQLGWRITPKTYSFAETAWRALGAAYLWSVVLSGAKTLEEAITMDPAALDLLQAALNKYAPGHFPDSMPCDQDTLLERTDEVIALLSAQLMEMSPAMRTKEFRTWWGAAYTGDETVARLMYRVAHFNGHLHSILLHGKG